MIMGGKEGLGPQKLRIADMLHHRPGNGKAVKGTGAPSDLIQHQKAVFRGIPEDIRHLRHLHHKGTLTAGQIIRCAHAGKDPVADSDIGILCRHKASDLRHKNDQGHLPHVGGFSRHIRSGDNGNPVLPVIQGGVIGHKQVIPHHLFHHRMAAVLDLNHALFIDGRLHIIMPRSHHRKGGKYIDSRQSLGRLLDPHHLGGNLIPHLAEQIVLQGNQFLLCPHNDIFQVFQFIGSKPLAVYQGLLAHKVIGNHVLEGIAYFKIIAEYFVEFYL